MTFEQWWAHENWDGLKVSTPAEAMAARRIAAACWNSALDAADERCDCNACNFDDLYVKGVEGFVMRKASN